MAAYRILLLLVGCCTLGLPRLAGAQATCSAIEIGSPFDVEYNQLLCEGIQSMQDGQYAAATRAFETALTEKFNETPNFKLFTRLAVAYFKAGNVVRARETLAKAELSLSVAIGIAKCRETEKGDTVLTKDGRPVAEPHGIVEVMCGAIYEDVYRFRNFRSAVHEGQLVQAYLDAEQLILGSPREPRP